MISTDNNKISIVVPCYNENKTIERVIDKIYYQKLENFEVIIVDDFSNDGSKSIIENLKNKYENLDYIFHEKNYGKGRAIKNGIKKSKGDIILIQDLDLEYDPDDYKLLILPFIKYDADVVFGSRFFSGTGPKFLFILGIQLPIKS